MELTATSQQWKEGHSVKEISESLGDETWEQR